MTEQDIQNSGRNALAGKCLCFRANVGKGWTGDVTRLSNGDLLIKNPRPFDTGLPKGFADTFGIVPVVVTPAMVGTTVGIFHAVEYKTPTGRLSKEQQNFLAAITKNGGRAGVARAAEEAVKIVVG